MSLSPTQQLTEMIKRSQQPLIILPAHAGADHFAAAFGLQQVVAKLDKTMTVVSTAELPRAIRSLVKEPVVHGQIPNLHSLLIEVDLSPAELDGLKHEVADGTLKIHLTPKTGSWKSEHVRVRPSSYQYDLIVMIGCPDLPSCGALFYDQPEFFYHTPIINIDHSPANEHFGQINLVDLTATACGEVCHSLVSEMDNSLIDEQAATLFLTGMIANTKSFKSRNVTPKTLSIASALVGSGARREEIVHHLYRTRSVATLRLWGRALARLKSDPAKKLVWTMLSAQDFLHAGAADGDLPEVIDELIGTSPEVESVLLLYENANHHVCGILRVNPPGNALTHLKSFAPTGTAAEAHVDFPTMNLVEAEREILRMM